MRQCIILDTCAHYRIFNSAYMYLTKNVSCPCVENLWPSWWPLEMHSVLLPSLVTELCDAIAQLPTSLYL